MSTIHPVIMTPYTVQEVVTSKEKSQLTDRVKTLQNNYKEAFYYNALPHRNQSLNARAFSTLLEKMQDTSEVTDWHVCTDNNKRIKGIAIATFNSIYISTPHIDSDKNEQEAVIALLRNSRNKPKESSSTQVKRPLDSWLTKDPNENSQPNTPYNTPAKKKVKVDLTKTLLAEGKIDLKHLFI